MWKRNRDSNHSQKKPREEGREQLTADVLYRSLASARRRQTLYILLDGEARTVEELATILTGWDVTETGSMGTPEERESVIIDLLHTHLPFLTEAGLVTHDRDRGVVELDSVHPLVEEITRESVSAHTA